MALGSRTKGTLKSIHRDPARLCLALLRSSTPLRSAQDDTVNVNDYRRGRPVYRSVFSHSIKNKKRCAIRAQRFVYCFIILLIDLLIFWLCWVFLLCGLFSSCSEWEPLSGCGAQASHCGGFSCCGAPGSPGAWASVVAAHRFSCSIACGIFLNQGLIPCLLSWQADSLPLSHRGSPFCMYNFTAELQSVSTFIW